MAICRLTIRQYDNILELAGRRGGGKKLLRLVDTRLLVRTAVVIIRFFAYCIYLRNKLSLAGSIIKLREAANICSVNDKCNSGRAALGKQAVYKGLCGKLCLCHTTIFVHTVGVVDDKNNIRGRLIVLALNGQGDLILALRLR